MPEGPRPDPARWVDRHGDAMYGYALLQLGDPDAAEERVQEALLAGLEVVHTFRGESTERTWLIAILRNKIRDHFRRRGVAARAGVRPIPGGFDESGKWMKGEPRAWGADPIASASGAEFWATFSSCLAALPPPLRDAFSLRELHGLETEGACEALEISRNNLWTMLHRSRSLLRRCLEQHWFAPTEESS